MEPPSLVIVIISLLFSAFFSGTEMAFVSANKLQIELRNKQGYLSGRILSRFIKSPSEFLATALVGNTISLVIYGIFMAILLEPWLETILPEPLQNQASILVIQTLIATILVLIFAEFIPKSVFLLNPDSWLAFFSLPLLLIHYLLLPLVFLVVGGSRWVIRYVLRLEFSDESPVFGMTDLNNFIKNTVKFESEMNKLDVNARLFNNALEFKTVRVRECMIPRTEITAIDIEDSIEDLSQAFIKSGHSKIVVYRDSIDDVLGFCHSLELFKKPKNLESILTPMLIVPETMLANELLIQFINERKSLALVVDEFGGTSGIVSIEDIIEEIFGEIQDEHDDENLVEQQLDSKTFIFSGRHEIDYLNEKYFLSLPEGDYDTLGGLILLVNGDIPNINEVIKLPPFLFTIQSMNNMRIGNVKLSLMNPQSNED